MAIAILLLIAILLNSFFSAEPNLFINKYIYLGGFKMEIVSTLLLAWLLSLFSLDEILIKGINQILNTNFDISVYWLTFFLVGAIIQIIQVIRNRNK